MDFQLTSVQINLHLYTGPAEQPQGSQFRIERETWRAKSPGLSAKWCQFCPFEISIHTYRMREVPKNPISNYKCSQLSFLHVSTNPYFRVHIPKQTSLTWFTVRDSLDNFKAREFLAKNCNFGPWRNFQHASYFLDSRTHRSRQEQLGCMGTVEQARPQGTCVAICVHFLCLWSIISIFQFQETKD